MRGFGFIEVFFGCWGSNGYGGEVGGVFRFF